jgi:hypothetical protein
LYPPDYVAGFAVHTKLKHSMNSLVLMLDAEKLEKPDLDLRYAIPDLLSAQSNGNIHDNGYDYEDNENQSSQLLVIFLIVGDLLSAIATISHIVQHEIVLGNNLSLAATLYIEKEGSRSQIPFVGGNA